MDRQRRDEGFYQAGDHEHREAAGHQLDRHRAVFDQRLAPSPGAINDSPIINPAPPAMKIAVNSSTACPATNDQSVCPIPYLKTSALMAPNCSAVFFSM